MTDERLKQAVDAFKRALAKEDWQAMIVPCTTIIEFEPSAEAYVNRGNAYSALEDYARAIEDYSAAIKLDPANQMALKERGLAHFYLASYDASIADFSRLISISANSAGAYYSRGCGRLQLAQYLEAIEDFTMAVKLDPAHAMAYGNRGNAYDAIEEYEKAVADFTCAIKIDPNDTGAYFNRGNEYGKLNQPEKAIADYTAALVLQPNDESLLFNRAFSFTRCGQLEKALDDFSAVIELESELSLKALWERANLHEKMGETELANRDRESVEDAARLMAQLANQEEMDKTVFEFLKKKDSSLSAIREIDHVIICPANQCAAIISRLQKLGFKVDEPDDSEDDQAVIEFHEQASPESMNKRSAELVEIAHEFGGVYDGWGTTII